MRVSGASPGLAQGLGRRAKRSIAWELAAVVPIAATSLLAVPGCGTSEAQDPSYLLVELIPAESASKAPQAARVQISNETTVLTTLCVNIGGPAGEPAASFVLRRDLGKPAEDRIAIEVSGYEAVSGQDTVDTGKEFACPSTLPAPVGPPQIIGVDFCASESRRLSFHVGAECGCGVDGGAGCGCAMDETCGAGLTTEGKDCAETACCKRDVSSACALEPAK